MDNEKGDEEKPMSVASRLGMSGIGFVSGKAFISSF
jgi:hypothetical protein